MNHNNIIIHYSYQPMSSSYRELVNYWKGIIIYIYKREKILNGYEIWIMKLPFYLFSLIRFWMMARFSWVILWYPCLLHCSIPIHQNFLFNDWHDSWKYRQHHLLFFTTLQFLTLRCPFSSFSSSHAKGLLTQSENNINFGSVCFFLWQKRLWRKPLTWSCLTTLKIFHQPEWEIGKPSITCLPHSFF